MRWIVLVLLFLSMLLNYLDRQSVAVLKPEISREFGLNDSGYSILTTVFMIPYVLMYVLGGRMVDRWGSGPCMTIFVSVWSMATLAGGFARRAWQMATSRFVLGLAEPGNIPAALRAVTTWFPSTERGTAVAIFTAGSALGAVIAPPVIATITGHYGWRAVFIALGATGLAQVILWLAFYREPAGRADAANRERVSFRTLLGNRAVRDIALARLVSDPVWYVMLFWLPAFLREKQGLTLAALGALGWIPFLAADLGGIGSSFLADSFIRSGGNPITSRMKVLKWTAWFGPLTLLLIFPLSTPIALVIFCVVGTTCYTWFSGSAALVGELLPKGQVAGAMGIVGAVGALGGLLVNAAVGPAIGAIGFGPTLAVLALLHPLAYWRLQRHLHA